MLCGTSVSRVRGAGILPAFLDPNGEQAFCPGHGRPHNFRRGPRPIASARTTGTEPGRYRWRVAGCFARSRMVTECPRLHMRGVYGIPH